MQKTSSWTDGSSGCNTANGFHSQHSQCHSGGGEEEVSRSLAVPCFQPKQVGREHQAASEKKKMNSGFRPCVSRATPFSNQSKSALPVGHNRDDRSFAGALCEAGLVDKAPSTPKPSHRNGKTQPVNRSKSQLLAEIADEISQSYQPTPRHARKSSADSHDSWGEPHRSKGSASRKRKLRLMKSASLNTPAVVISAGAKRRQDDWNPIQGSPTASSNLATYPYAQDMMPRLPLEKPAYRMELGQSGHSRVPRKKHTGRHRTSIYIGVGSSNRKNQWQARILVQGKVTHLGYYSSEEEAATIYDRVALAMNPSAATNFAPSRYPKATLGEFSGLGREDLQRALGVKPMDKSSRFRGVSRKKGKWEAKVMVNRKWAFRALYDSENEAALAYDAAVWRLKPKEATSFVNFKDGVQVRNPAGHPSKGLTRSRSEALHQVRLSSEESEDLDLDLSRFPSQTLTLTETHIPRIEVEEHPLADLRRHSVHLPVTTPVMQQDLPTDRSLSTGPSGIGMGRIPHLPSAQNLPEELELDTVSHQTIIPSLPAVHSPHKSVQSEPLGAVAPLALPDPNSIGLPPAENLPYPDLVKAPLSRSASGVLHRYPSVAEALNRYPSNGETAVSCSPLASPVLTRQHPVHTLPQQPPINVVLKQEDPSVAGYYSSSPFSHNMNQSLAATNERLLDETQRKLNPFQEDSSLQPSVPSITNSPRVHLGSLKSMPCPLPSFPEETPNIAPLHMSPVPQHHLSRAASESVLQSTPTIHQPAEYQGNDMPMHLVVDQHGSYMLHSAGTSSSLGLHSTHSAASLHSYPASAPLPPPTVFQPDLQMSAYSASNLSQMDSGSFEYQHTASSGLLQPQHATVVPINRSMSTNTVGPLMTTGVNLMHQNAAVACNPAPKLHHAVSLDSAQLPIALQNATHISYPVHMMQQYPMAANHPTMERPADHEATELMAALGVDINMPDCQMPLQTQTLHIGGEEMHVFPTKSLSRDFMMDGGHP